MTKDVKNSFFSESYTDYTCKTNLQDLRFLQDLVIKKDYASKVHLKNDRSQTFATIQWSTATPKRKAVSLWFFFRDACVGLRSQSLSAEHSGVQPLGFATGCGMTRISSDVAVHFMKYIYTYSYIQYTYIQGLQYALMISIRFLNDCIFVFNSSFYDSWFPYEMLKFENHIKIKQCLFQVYVRKGCCWVFFCF